MTRLGSIITCMVTFKPREVEVITEAMFIKATGRAPIRDDMERVNCSCVGGVGHTFCGWNKVRNCPMFDDRKHWPKDETCFKFEIGKTPWRDIQWVADGKCPYMFYNIITSPNQDYRGKFLIYDSLSKDCTFEIVSASLGKIIEAFDFCKN